MIIKNNNNNVHSYYHTIDRLIVSNNKSKQLHMGGCITLDSS